MVDRRTFSFHYDSIIFYNEIGSSASFSSDAMDLANALDTEINYALKIWKSGQKEIKEIKISRRDKI